MKNKITCNIIPFLKAILARMLLEINGNHIGEDELLLKKLLTERDIIFDQMLNDAVSFCNNKEGEGWKNVQKELDE